MTGFRVLYLVLGISFLFLSCSENNKKVPSVKRSYNNDHLLFTDNKKVESEDNDKSIKYEFNVGNLAVIVDEDRIYDVKYYSRLNDESDKKEVYFLDEELLDKFSEEELKQEVMGGVAFNSVVLDESRYEKEFKNSGIESLEILFYQEKNLRKIEFDLLEGKDSNKKFESASLMEEVYNEVIEGLNVRWFIKEDNSSNVSKYTIYLETSINNIDLKQENIGVNSMDESGSFDSPIDDKVVSIMYRSSFIGEFDETNKDKLFDEFTNILKELRNVGNISNI